MGRRDEPRAAPRAPATAGRISRRGLLQSAGLLLAGHAGAATAAPALVTGGSGSPHVAVIGAGAFGVWSALHLRRRGARVTLIDAWGPGNSRSSSGGETRVLRSIYGPDRIYVEMVRDSLEQWREAEERWGTRLYRRTGSLWMFSVEDAYVRAALPIVRELGFTVEELSLAAAARRYPQIDLTGIRTVYLEHEAGHLAARRACLEARDGLLAEGGVYRCARAEPGPIAGGRLRHLRLSGGSTLAADAYVFACGPWLGRLFPEVIGDGVQPSRQEVYYFGVPAGSTDYSEGVLPIWIDFGERLVYGIPGVDRRGFKLADDTRGEPFDPTSGDRTVTAAGVTSARRFLARRFPGLAEAPLVEARVCQYENSPDGDLLIDRHPEAENVWIAGGGSGHGFKLSPAVGRRVAGMVLDGAAPRPEFALARLVAAGRQSTQFDTEP